MGFKIALNPFRDPMHGPDFPQQEPIVIQRLAEQLADYPHSVRFETRVGEQGAGASWPVIILEVLAMGSSVFFGLPKFYTKIGKAVEGWKQIWSDIQRFIQWLSRKDRICRYSIEVAFYYSLARLSKRTDVRDLEVIQAQEVFGQGGFVPASFENTEVVYYLFMLREQDRVLHIVCVDHMLKVYVDQSLPLVWTADLSETQFLEPPSG